MSMSHIHLNVREKLTLRHTLFGTLPELRGSGAGTNLRTLEIDTLETILRVLDWSFFIKVGDDQAGQGLV